jgi:hypothetical protein
MPESTTAVLATHISNPWRSHGPNPKERTKPETWHRIVLTNPPSPLLQRLRAYSIPTLKFGFALLSLRVCAGSAIQRPVH